MGLLQAVIIYFAGTLFEISTLQEVGLQLTKLFVVSLGVVGIGQLGGNILSDYVSKSEGKGF